METVRDYMLGVLNKASELDKYIDTNSAVEYNIRKEFNSFRIQFRYEGIDFYTVFDRNGILVEEDSSFERDKTSKELNEIMENYITNRYDYNSPRVNNSNLDFFTFRVGDRNSIRTVYNVLTDLLNYIIDRRS